MPYSVDGYDLQKMRQGVAIDHTPAVAAVFPICYGHTLPGFRSESWPSTSANSSSRLLEIHAERIDFPLKTQGET
jgi:hypothetical protein